MGNHQQNEKQLPSLLITGASGIIGRHLLNAVSDDFRIFCITRRSQRDAGVPPHKNIFWMQTDIGVMTNISEIAESIARYGGVDYVIHLAGYYDFTLKDCPEYESTNVKGTLNMLELAKHLKVKRFLFASSLAACLFSKDYNNVVNEESPPDADFPYAHTKRKGEKMMAEYSEFFPCTILRFAAVYSDWCEYPPLYNFLETWLSKKWDSKILGGKGEASITYIHINDLIKLFLRVIEKSEKLPGFSVYIASPAGTVSHNNLYKAATKYFYGKTLKAIRMPKYIAYAGVLARYYIGKLTGKEPFERPWMMKYVDKKLIVENAFTCSQLEWAPTHRYDIIRRLLLITGKKKNNYAEWKLRNEAALSKTAYRPNVHLYEILLASRDMLVEKMIVYMYLAPDSRLRFPNYRRMEIEQLKKFVTLCYQVIAVTIKSRDTNLLNEYVKAITLCRFHQGFNTTEISNFSQTLVSIINNTLLSRPELSKSKQEILDFINMTLQLAVDEMEDYYEQLKAETDINTSTKSGKKFIVDIEEIERCILMLEDSFFDTKTINFTSIFRVDK